MYGSPTMTPFPVAFSVRLEETLFYSIDDLTYRYFMNETIELTSFL
jgi:hypothetical protein